jgi:hypothetical protein
MKNVEEVNVIFVSCMNDSERVSKGDRHERTRDSETELLVLTEAFMNV